MWGKTKKKVKENGGVMSACETMCAHRSKCKPGYPVDRAITGGSMVIGG